MALTPLKAKQFADDDVVVAIGKGARPQGHTGISFKRETGDVQLVHLCGHHRMGFDTVPGAREGEPWLCHDLGLNPLAKKRVASYIREAMKLLAMMPQDICVYGIDFVAAKGSFRADGSYAPPLGSSGMTCASFVTEVLRGAGLELVDYATWKPTPQGKKWAEELAQYFRKAAFKKRCHKDLDTARDYERRAVAIANTKTGTRLLPAEVMGAATMSSTDWPATFDTVRVPANQVQAELDAAIAATTHGV